MATTGAKFPASAQNISEAPWSDNTWDAGTETGITASGGGQAAVAATATFDTGDQSFVLKAYGFDFSAIPDGSTIDGVTCVVSAREAVSNGALGLAQLLDTSRAKVGTNQWSTEQALTTSLATYTVGSSSDNWGNALTAAWVKDPDFGVALACWSRAANTDVFIDYVTLEVTYTAPPPTTTATAVVSLASGGTPDTRTLHTLNVRARVTTGSGTMRLRLYEGATPICAELETSALTGTLADYQLAIPDVDAEDITSYANLEVRFRGYSALGTAAVFEVAEVWLQAPEGTAVAATPRQLATLGVG